MRVWRIGFCVGFVLFLTVWKITYKCNDWYSLMNETQWHGVIFSIVHWKKTAARKMVWWKKFKNNNKLNRRCVYCTNLWTDILCTLHSMETRYACIRINLHLFGCLRTTRNWKETKWKKLTKNTAQLSWRENNMVDSIRETRTKRSRNNNFLSCWLLFLPKLKLSSANKWTEKFITMHQQYVFTICLRHIAFYVIACLF